MISPEGTDGGNSSRTKALILEPVFLRDREDRPVHRVASEERVYAVLRRRSCKRSGCSGCSQIQLRMTSRKVFQGTLYRRSTRQSHRGPGRNSYDGGEVEIFNQAHQLHNPLGETSPLFRVRQPQVLHTIPAARKCRPAGASFGTKSSDIESGRYRSPDSSSSSP